MIPVGERGDFFCLPAHAGGHSEGGCYGGEYCNDNIQYLAPNVFAHDWLNDS